MTRSLAGDAPGRAAVLGYAIDRVTPDQAIAAVGRWLGGAPGDPARLVVTANPEILMAARRDPQLATILKAADLVVADGIGVVWAAGVLGCPVPGRVAGVDLMYALLARAAREGWRPYFLGTHQDRVARAAEAARRLFPGLRLAGWHHGYFPPDADEAVAGLVRAARPDLLFAGMGAERELKWIHRFRTNLGARVAMGVGGSLDVLAGVTPRAPGWLRAVHLEWLYRLLREPRRWRRQLVLPRFVLAVLAQRRRDACPGGDSPDSKLLRK